MKCASCGAAVHPSADFCRVCGADAPRPSARSTPRLSGIEALKSVRLPGAGSLRRPSLPSLPARSPRAAVSALRLSAPALPAGVAMPRISRRAALIAAGVAAGVMLALLLVQAGLGATSDDSEARALAAAQDALRERDAKIASLEGTIATNQQAQSALQSSAQSAAQENGTLRQERDAAQQQIATLEAKVAEIEGRLEEQLATNATQQESIRTLSSCLNGTSVAVAFGRTGRWNSADLALAAVADACKASESLLAR